MINIYFILHVICTILVISIAFLPIKFIKQSGIFIIPCCLTILWLFTTCPLNKYHNNDKEDFLLEFLRKNISKTITEKQFNRIIGLFLGLIVILSAYKIISNCNFNK